MRNVFKWCVRGAVCPLLVACTGTAPPASGGAAYLIRPTGQHCTYSIGATQLQTLDSLAEIRGKVGRVLVSDLDLDSSPQILDMGIGFRPVATRYKFAGDGYFPMDYRTLAGLSLYYAIETGYLLHAKLDPAADFVANVPGFADKTSIVLDAKRTVTDGKVRAREFDNAEYLPREITSGGTTDVRNYFLSYPTEDLTGQMPLGINSGILVHEYTHLVFEYLFRLPLAKNGVTQLNFTTDGTVGSLDEGLADYFGFLATGDPGFFLCTFPDENRDLSVPKNYTAQMDNALKTSDTYDIHAGGAVFAAINYEIGQAMGSHQENAKTVLALMQQLPGCGGVTAGSTSNLTFGKVAACHAQAGGSRSDLIQSIYDKHLEVNEK